MSEPVALKAGTRVVAVIAALFLPPLAVFLTHGLCPAFWISVFLTLFAWIPGVIFALIAVLAPSALGRLAA